MLNVNALQKTLSSMTLPEIQKYASLHKNDPYVVAMALSVANTKKEAQTAMQGMAGQQPMPKVVDQDIAGIAAVHPQQAAPAPGAAPQLPEEQGIGQLPAQNLQGMAGGGIVAFDEGGEVERYDAGGRITQADVRKAYDAWQASQPSWFQQTTPTSKQRQDAAEAEYTRMLNAYHSQSNLSQPSGAGISQLDTVPYNALTATRLSDFQQGATGAGQTGIGTPPAADKTGTTPAPTVGGIGVPSANSYIERFKKELPALETAPTKEEVAKEYNDVYAPLNEKMQAMLDKERGKLKGDKEEALFMAMLRGGLAAAGGTSQYGLTNLAKGFEQGAVDYAGSLKDLRQAAKEQTKMEMDFEKAKADLAAGNIDRFYKRVDAVQERNAKIRQLETSGVAGLLSDEMRARATVQAAGAAANAQLGLFQQLGAAPEGSALRKGFDIYKQTSSEPTLYANYAKLSADTEFDPTSGKTKGELFRSQYPSFQAFMAGFGGGGAGQVYNTLPQNANVLKSPGVR